MSVSCTIKQILLVITFKVTPTTFYEISKISHIGSVFRKSVCIRVVHIFCDRASSAFPFFRETGIKTLKIYE